jgi:hypothetical protein
VRRSTESTTRTFPRYAALSPSAARSARAGSRERAAAIRARSRAQSSARASLRCCRTSPRAGASAGNAASGPAVARAETGSGPERTASRGTHGLATSRNPTTPGSASSSRSRPGLSPLGRPLTRDHGAGYAVVLARGTVAPAHRATQREPARLGERDQPPGARAAHQRVPGRVGRVLSAPAPDPGQREQRAPIPSVPCRRDVAQGRPFAPGPPLGGVARRYTDCSSPSARTVLPLGRA